MIDKQLATPLCNCSAEIERLKATADSRVDDIVRQHDILTDVIADKRNEITQLEKEKYDIQKNFLAIENSTQILQKENAELSKDLKMCREIGVEMQREVNRKQTIQMNKLTAQLAIATEALEVIRDTGSRISPTYAAQALAKIKLLSE